MTSRAPWPLGLFWRQEDHSRPPGHIWRLYAPPPTVAALGGAPCFSSACPGQIGYVVRDRGLWHGEIELTPYDSVKTKPRRRHTTALADVIAAVREHLGVSG